MDKEVIMRLFLKLFLGLSVCSFFSCETRDRFDVWIHNGVIYDGSGEAPYQGSVGIIGDTIAYVGPEVPAIAELEIDAGGQAVCPGFINMLSWANESLIHDGRGLSDIMQGVTLEVMGEGVSMGPLNQEMKDQLKESQGDIKYDIEWTTLGEYLEFLERKGVSPNIASFVGATTVRIHELGYENRRPTEEELGRMKQLVAQAMEEGALGVSSSLIYAPAFYASTDELVAMCKVAGSYGGMYITHMRSEGNRLMDALEEVITIATDADIPAEIYHLKAAGESNWHKMDSVIARIESVHNSGLRITADMYTYTAGSTGLNAAMPPWVQEGGYDEWVRRLLDPAIRKKVVQEMQTDAENWENLLYAAGSAENVLLVDFHSDSLRQYTGKSLAEVAAIRGTGPEETAIDLVIKDGSRVGAVYFLMKEENLQKQIQLRYMSFGSDGSALAPEGIFLNSNPHPRAYGNFARLLGKYVRDEKIISLSEAIHRLTFLSAVKLEIYNRGGLVPGFYADVVVFDPARIADLATYENPHQLAVGVTHVFVNGEHVVNNSLHTGALPGRVVRGRGYLN